MASRVFILPYKRGSASAKELGMALDIKGIRLKNSKFKPTPRKSVINWGNCQGVDDLNVCTIINRPEYVADAADKVRAFELMKANDVSIPDFTENKDEAISWAESGDIVLCRSLRRGYGGAGIVVANSPEEVVGAKFYTRYIKKRDEFRVHVFGGQVIDVQRKMRKKDVPDDRVDWKIRNHSNGFIFGREDVSPADDVLQQAVNAVAALRLDFGAVDVIWNEHHGKAYVLEVNTAPGLEGTTLEKYVEAFKELLGDKL